LAFAGSSRKDGENYWELLNKPWSATCSLQGVVRVRFPNPAILRARTRWCVAFTVECNMITRWSSRTIRPSYRVICVPAFQFSSLISLDQYQHFSGHRDRTIFSRHFALNRCASSNFVALLARRQHSSPPISPSRYLLFNTCMHLQDRFEGTKGTSNLFR
jgi:hypothetical protein